MSTRRHHHCRQPSSVWVADPHRAKPRVAEWLEDRTLLSADAANSLFGDFTIQLASLSPASADESVRPFAAKTVIVNLTQVDSTDGVAMLAEPTTIDSLSMPETASTVLLLDLAELMNRTGADTQSLEAAIGSGSTFEFSGELLFDSDSAEAAPHSLLDLIDSAAASLLTESGDSMNGTASNSASVTAIGRIVPSSVSDDSGDSPFANQLELTLTVFVASTQSLADVGSDRLGGDRFEQSSATDASFPTIVVSRDDGDSPQSDSVETSQLTPNNSDNSPIGDGLFATDRPSFVAGSRTQSTDTALPATQPRQSVELLVDVSSSGSSGVANDEGTQQGLRRLASLSRFISSSTDRGPQAASGDSLTTAFATRSERSMTEFSGSVAAAIEVAQQFDGNWIEPFQPIIGMTGSLLLAVQSLGKSVLLSVFGDSGSGDGPLAAFVEPLIEQADVHFLEAPDRWELKTVEPQYEAAFTRLAQAGRHFEIRNIGPAGDDAPVEVLIPTSFAIISSPQHGQLESVGSRSMRFQYLPDPGFSGVDSFRYRATAADGKSLDGIIVLTVRPGSQATPRRTASLAHDAEIEVATLDAEQTGDFSDDVAGSFEQFEDWRGELD